MNSSGNDSPSTSIESTKTSQSSDNITISTPKGPKNVWKRLYHLQRLRSPPPAPLQLSTSTSLDLSLQSTQSISTEQASSKMTKIGSPALTVTSGNTDTHDETPVSSSIQPQVQSSEQSTTSTTKNSFLGKRKLPVVSALVAPNFKIRKLLSGWKESRHYSGKPSLVYIF